MNDVACFQLLHGGLLDLFINYHDYLISNLTDLSASNDVSMIFKDTLRSETQIFLIPKSHLHFVYQSSTSVIAPIK